MTAEIKYTPEQVFGADKIAEWKKDGHWPPPEGCTVLPELHPKPEEVRKLMVSLMNLVAPDQRKLIQEVIYKFDRNY